MDATGNYGHALSAVTLKQRDGKQNNSMHVPRLVKIGLAVYGCRVTHTPAAQNLIFVHVGVTHTFSL
jgi:hypothetical protein